MVCGPIIFDKSAIQSLSLNEIQYLHRYYHLVLTPILLAEFVGDLAKTHRDGSPAMEKVTELAHKINPSFTVMNSKFDEIVLADIMSGEGVMEYRPVKLSRLKTGIDGKVVAEILPTEERILEEWKNGYFDPQYFEVANSWRASFNVNPTEQRKKFLMEKLQFERFNGMDLPQIKDEIQENLNNADLREEILLSALDICQIPEHLNEKIIQRWNECGKPSLEEMSGYAFYCTLLSYTFDAGLALNLIGTRSTNLIDLQYLFYLPFCRSFVSGDGFHDLMAPLFLAPHQTYIRATDLKQDLREIANFIEGLAEPDRKRYSIDPPELLDSVTFKLSQTHGLPETILRKRRHADAKFDEIRVEKVLSLHSLCPCGSGKLIKDCHLKSA
jgi:hypothetical protein